MRDLRSNNPRTTFRLSDVFLNQFSFRKGKSVIITLPDGTTHKGKSVVIRPQTAAGRAKVAIRSNNYALVQEKRGNAKLIKNIAGQLYNKLAKVGWWEREACELKRLLNEDHFKSINDVTEEVGKKLFQSMAFSNSEDWKENHKLWPIFLQYKNFVSSAYLLDTQVKTLMANLGGINPLKTTLVVTR